MAHNFGKFVLTMCLMLSTAGCMSVVETPDDLVLLELHAPQKRESPGWMHVVIGSKFDFQKYSFENKNHVMLESLFCNMKKYDAFLEYPTIYANENGSAIPSESLKKAS
jgi:hypothetical protein